MAAFLRSQAYIHPELLDGFSLQHSLGLALTTKDSPNGRRAGSGFWGGLAKTRYWIDPTTGVIVSASVYLSILIAGILWYSDPRPRRPAHLCRRHGQDGAYHVRQPGIRETTYIHYMNYCFLVYFDSSRSQVSRFLSLGLSLRSSSMRERSPSHPSVTNQSTILPMSETAQ